MKFLITTIDTIRSFIVDISMFISIIFSSYLRVPEPMIKKITYQVLKAVEFCHNHNVIEVYL